MEYLLHFLSKIQPLSKEADNNVLKRLLAALTQRSVTIRNKNLYKSKLYFNNITKQQIHNIFVLGKFMPKLRDGTLTCAIEFVQRLAHLTEGHHIQSTDTTNIALLDVKLKSDSIYDFNVAFH